MLRTSLLILFAHLYFLGRALYLHFWQAAGQLFPDALKLLSFNTWALVSKEKKEGEKNVWGPSQTCTFSMCSTVCVIATKSGLYLFCLFLPSSKLIWSLCQTGRFKSSQCFLACMHDVPTTTTKKHLSFA